MTRRFVDAPAATRCTATITLKDGSAAQCGRHQKVGTLCTQHSKMETKMTGQLGEVMSVEILRPGAADVIAKNGWPCSYPECDAKPTTEVRFTRRARSFSGYSVGSHGACDAHAKAHARSLKSSPSASEG